MLWGFLKAQCCLVLLHSLPRAPPACQAIGVRPDAGLAKAAGLELGPRGGIRVNEHMQTSDPHIFAVGDVVEVKVRRPHCCAAGPIARCLATASYRHACPRD